MELSTKMRITHFEDCFCDQKCKWTGGTNLKVILVSISTLDKANFNKKINFSNVYMEFERNQVLKNLECPQVASRKWRPFWWPSGLGFIGQSAYSN